MTNARRNGMVSIPSRFAMTATTTLGNERHNERRFPNFVGAIALDRCFHMRRCSQVRENRERLRTSASAPPSRQRPLRIMRLCQECVNEASQGRLGFDTAEIPGYDGLSAPQQSVFRRVPWAGRVFGGLGAATQVVGAGACRKFPSVSASSLFGSIFLNGLMILLGFIVIFALKQLWRW